MIDDLRADAKIVFNTNEGVRILQDLEARFGVHQTTFSQDSHETAFREGQRSAVLFDLNLMKEGEPDV